MGTFPVQVEVSSLDASRFEVMTAWADSGALYKSLPTSLLQQLGVAPVQRDEVIYADGRHEERDLGMVLVRVGDRITPSLCVFIGEEAPILLGAMAMEGLRLIPDVVNQRLVPMPFVPLLRLR